MKKAIVFAAVTGAVIMASPAPSAFGADAAVGNYGFDKRSWYVEVRAGGAIPVNHSFNSAATGPGEYKPGSGFGISVDIGKYLTDNWRAEMGLVWNRGSGGNATLAGGAPIPHSGSVNAYSLMFGGAYAFNTNSSLMPYIGAGIGLTYFDFDGLGATGGAFTITGSDTVFTASLATGLDFKVADKTTLTSRYNLIWTDGGSYSTTTPGLTVTTSSQTEHMFSVGVRFDLN